MSTPRGVILWGTQETFANYRGGPVTQFLRLLLLDFTAWSLHIPYTQYNATCVACFDISISVKWVCKVVDGQLATHSVHLPLARSISKLTYLSKCIFAFAKCTTCWPRMFTLWATTYHTLKLYSLNASIRVAVGCRALCSTRLGSLTSMLGCTPPRPPAQQHRCQSATLGMCMPEK